MGKVIGTFSGKCCDANIVNNNDMHLGTELFENLFASEEYKRALENGHYIGFLGHPEDPGCQDYEHACIVMKQCDLKDNGDVEGSFDLIDTPVGQVVKAFIDAGVNFGISIRGAGDVDGAGEVDPETFVFRGFDLVTFPAYDDCIPEFKEIAASSDVNKQKKFKKICAAVNANLKKINSCGALEVIQEQFPEDSEEFGIVQERIDELNKDAQAEEEDLIAIAEEKVAGITDLYLNEVEKRHELEDSLAEQVAASKKIKAASERRLNSYKRIVATQLKDMESAIDASEDEAKALKKEIKASKRANIEASKKFESDNLTYVRKIDASEKIIASQKDTIEKLNDKVSKTVAMNKSVNSKLTDLTHEVEGLKASVAAAEEMILSYQKAYANMYANALGIHLDNIPVTSSTTVKDLQEFICAGTSTANIASAPRFTDVESEDEMMDEGEDFFQADDSDMVTM